VANIANKPLESSMSVRILIDGYNLLFQSGLGGRGRGPGWIVQARAQLIAFLHQQLHPQWASATTVVFDRSQGRNPQHDFVSAAGIQVLFATDHPEADDMIEELIAQHSAPKSLIVVSSDLRVRRKAITRRAQSLDSETFLRNLESGDFLLALKPENDSTKVNHVSNYTQEQLTESEIQYWLREFGDL
jgi:uncharacterized protein